MEICGMNTCLNYNNEQESNCDRWLDGILNTCPHYNEAPKSRRFPPSNSSDLLRCEWRYGSYNDQMVAGCKDSWPGYKSVEMKFCFNCGKKIKHVSNVAI